MEHVIRKFICSKCSARLHNVSLAQVNAHKASHGIHDKVELNPNSDPQGLLIKSVFRKKKNASKKAVRESIQAKKRAKAKRITLLQRENNELKKIVEGMRFKKHPFYSSEAWRKVRFDILKKTPWCVLCKSKGRLHVDHIKPRSKFPHLELDPTNLQVLCEDCNLGKSNRDSTDFR